MATPGQSCRSVRLPKAQRPAPRAPRLRHRSCHAWLPPCSVNSSGILSALHRPDADPGSVVSFNRAQGPRQACVEGRAGGGWGAVPEVGRPVRAGQMLGRNNAAVLQPSCLALGLAAPVASGEGSAGPRCTASGVNAEL